MNSALAGNPRLEEMNASSLAKGQPIDGVRLQRLEVNSDIRGTFTEVFQQGWRSMMDPVQFSVVASDAGVMRGCHFHVNHDEYFCLIKGRASVGLRDERPGSSTFGRWSLYALCDDDPAALMFPSGIVHGWYFHEASVHLQGVSEAYGDYAHYDNHRVDWLDPDLEIPWPVREATTTVSAGSAPKLADLRRRLFSGR